MANQQLLNILMQGEEVWNEWRIKYRDVELDLSRANLSGIVFFKSVNLSEVNLSGANLSLAELNDSNFYGTNFSNANLSEAGLVGTNLSMTNFSRANLSGAILELADLTDANLSGANMKGADLCDANLDRTNLSGADLSGADLSGATLIKTVLVQANLTGCFIYGISVWNIQLDGAIQKDLRITDLNEPNVTVDNLEMAQFIHLLLNNKEIREVIDTITSKVVLILGHFTFERKTVLDALRDELRKRNYTPIIFDFEKPASRDFTETVRTLAHLARFIIADLTDPSSIPQELQAIIPTLAVPVQPVLLEGKREYSMFVDFLKTYHWVLPIHYYTDQTNLLTTLKEQVIEHDMWSYASLRETHA